jgi:isopentenyl diphosphate isomerase/L-lactate dehydrogenase-like FMN-dependent dehydrogenase
MALTIEDWRRQARQRLPRFAFDYLDGRAGNERCLDRNRRALDSLALVPDALCDVTDCSAKTLLFGHELAYPIILAPTGLNGLLWHDGDVALAHAARSVGIPSVISTASTSPINEVIAATETAGVAGARAMLLSRNLDRSLTWKSIDWLRERWPGRLVLKRILRPSDSKRAIECGVDGIVVSNHGGRQLDSAPATIDVLSAVLDAAGQTVPVLIDSGFPTADDIVKALALGASAVLLGRLPLYALAPGGEKGVTLALGALVEDLIRTLRLLGVSDIRKLRPDHVHAHRDQRLVSWNGSAPNTSLYVRAYALCSGFRIAD